MADLFHFAESRPGDDQAKLTNQNGQNSDVGVNDYIPDVETLAYRSPFAVLLLGGNQVLVRLSHNF
jgi:hypothetical protein